MHYVAAIHILRHIKGTIFHDLHFSSQSALDLHAFFDADWACDLTNHRSATEYCFLLEDSLLSWRSKKQMVVARSSTKVEYCALVKTIAKPIWLHWSLQDMGVSCTTPTPLYYNNQIAIQIAHNDIFHK